jgi:hypothetical protein
MKKSKNKKNRPGQGSGAAVCPVHTAGDLYAPPLGQPRDWYTSGQTMKRKVYESELATMQVELVKLLEWIRDKQAQGGGDLRGSRCRRQGRRYQAHHREASTRVSAGLPRIARRRPIVSKASGTSSATSPTCPAAGEMVLFDRSWYNRALVERVMGFCNNEQYRRVRALRPGIRAHAGALRHLADQVLVLDQRRGAGAPLPGAHPQFRRNAGNSRRWTWSPAASTESIPKPRTRC